MSQTNSHFNYVLEFMKTFSQTINHTPVAPTLKTLTLRHSLIDEEINELEEALYQDDLIEVADALTDILYVTYGAYATLGTVPKLSEQINHSELGNKVASLPSAADAISLVKTLRAKLKAFWDAFEDTWTGPSFYINQASINLDKILETIYSYSDKHHININACFDEVQSSNMSKVCKSYDDAKDSIEIRVCQGKTDYVGATIHENNGLFLIKRLSDGKVLKGKDFFEPNLADILS